MTASDIADRPLILIVEDDAESSAVFRLILETNGCAVRVAPDAEAAIGELGREVPAALLIDLRLPTRNGQQLLQQIRGVPSLAHVPAAVITGDYLVDDSVIHDIQVLGARVHFKPLWEDDLTTLVTSLLAEHRHSG